ncbi:hypothetical protein D3C86_927690 [compost metagenome]
MQVGTRVRRISPGRSRIAWLHGLPGDRCQLIVQLREEMASIFMGDETAEKLLIVGVVQSLAQLFGECGGRRVLLDRMFRVARNVSHHPDHALRTFEVWRKQQDAGKAGVHECQVMTTPRLTSRTSRRRCVEQAADQIVCVAGQQVLHLRHVQGSAQRCSLAFTDFGLQCRCDHGIADAQIGFQIGFITLANIEFPAQTGKRRNGHFFLDLRQGSELPDGGGRRDVSRGRFEGVVAGFCVFEVVQRRVQQ